MLHPVRPSICRPKAWQGSSVPKKFRWNTKLTPAASRSKKLGPSPAGVFRRRCRLGVVSPGGVDEDIAGSQPLRNSFRRLRHLGLIEDIAAEGCRRAARRSELRRDGLRVVFNAAVNVD